MILKSNAKMWACMRLQGQSKILKEENTGVAPEVPTPPKRNPRSYECHTKELFQRFKEKE